MRDRDASAGALELELPTRRATRHLAAALAALLHRGDLVWLEGELGAGKTFFTRGVLRGLGVPSEIPITSPTFALVHEHDARIPVRHLDLYRLGDPDELRELGVDEALDDVVTIIEWGRRFRSAVGERGIELELEAREAGRHAHVRALDERGSAIVRALADDPRVKRLAQHAPCRT